MKIRIVVFGGRHYVLRHRVWYELHELIHGYRMSDVTIIHGACPEGTDEFAHQFCEDWKPWGLIEEAYPAKWRDIDVPGAVIRTRNGIAYNILAGFQRNQKMIDVGRPTHALGTPGGRGTADMLRRLKVAIDGGATIDLQMID